jgi:hypothetical protein
VREIPAATAAGVEAYTLASRPWLNETYSFFGKFHCQPFGNRVAGRHNSVQPPLVPEMAARIFCTANLFSENNHKSANLEKR